MIRRKENNFKKFQELKVKTTKLPKVQEKHVFYIWLGESGASFLDQSQSKVK